MSDDMDGKNKDGTWEALADLQSPQAKWECGEKVLL